MAAELDDLTWLIAAGWEVVIAAGDHDGGAMIRVGLDDGSIFWGSAEDGLTQARRHSERQDIRP